jgi:hypothetical protein
MYTSITVSSASLLLITFSAQAIVSGGNYLYERAMVGGTQAYPITNQIELAGESTYWQQSSTTFYAWVSTGGTYAVYIQWRVGSGSGQVAERTLTVIALPS